MKIIKSISKFDLSVCLNFQNCIRRKYCVKENNYIFFVHFFLLISEKEERKRTKERRKNRCDHSLKIRSKSTSEFWEQVTAENAPASAFLVLNLRITDETPRKCEAWASIFVEMYALHFVPSLESQPFPTSHGLSFCFL